MLCIYYPISDVINKGNISNEEKMELLESYSKCMNSNFKDLTKEAKDRRKDLQDILLNNLTFKSLDASSSLIEAGQTVVRQNSLRSLRLFTLRPLQSHLQNDKQLRSLSIISSHQEATPS